MSLFHRLPALLSPPDPSPFSEWGRMGRPGALWTAVGIDCVSLISALSCPHISPVLLMGGAQQLGVGMRWGWEGLPSVSLDCPNSRCTAIRIFLMVDAGWCTLHLKSTEGPLLKNCNDFFVFINNLYKTINCYHHSNPIIHHHCNLVIIIAILSSSLLPYHHQYCKPANLRFSALNRPCLRFVFGSCWPVVIVIYCCLLLLLFVISAVVCAS